MVLRVVALLACLVVATGCARQDPGDDAQAIVVGAGIAGLSAAVEMGRAGIDVLVVETNSVPGGTAVRAGGIAMVGTPLQEQAGFADSPDLAYEDWTAWTGDGDPEWTRFYVENSRPMIYDWLTEMGVDFVRVVPSHGNSVPRFHFTQGRAVHVVLPLYRAALALPNVKFRWNIQASELLLEDGRIGGVIARNLRDGKKHTLRADHVVLATGGFQSDLDRVLANWTPGLPRPKSLKIGASVRALGSGHDMASDAGAAQTRIDRHYIYINGLPDPRDPAGERTLTAGNDSAMWVNSSGQRFTNEAGFDKDILVDLLQQEPDFYWMIFDEATRDDFGMRGAAWLKNPGAGHPILDDLNVTDKAQSLAELASMAGLPADALAQSVQRFNDLIDAGEDPDFGRFSDGEAPPSRIEEPPFYAVRMFPVTRKNMGGVAIDDQARVVDESGQVIEGLYAAGELTGSVGINGRHGLDGMFLGPAVLTGRVAGQAVVAARPDRQVRTEAPPPTRLPDAGNDLEQLLATPRNGYWHFEQSHGLVVERDYACERCHFPDRRGQLAQTQVCTECH